MSTTGQTPQVGTSPKSKVTAVLSIACGCGFVAQTSQDAKTHAEKTGHILSVHGQIGEATRLSKVRLV